MTKHGKKLHIMLIKIKNNNIYEQNSNKNKIQNAVTT